MILKIIISLFVVFALSRVWLRYRDGSIGMFGTSVWTMLWLAAAGVVWWPSSINQLASLIGVGRGSDALVYVSITILFYALFRLYVKMEFIEHEITTLVRNLALKDQPKEK